MRFGKRLWLCTMAGVTLVQLQPLQAQAKSKHKSRGSEVVTETTTQSGTSERLSGESFSGNISWYGSHFNGKKTASGEIFDMNKPTAAHRTLNFGTRVLVEDPRTGKTVIVKVNDRGPFVRRRVMDVSREGAKRLGTLMDGIVFVDCLVITPS